jgi:hypothetical protein
MLDITVITIYFLAIIIVITILYGFYCGNYYLGKKTAREPGIGALGPDSQCPV